MSDLQENEGRRMGRPSTRTEQYKRTTIELPVSLLKFLETVEPNRTEYVIQAIQEKRQKDTS